MVQVQASNLLKGYESFDDLFKDNHVFIQGLTGSGKSYMMKDVYENTTLTGIYFNSEDEDVEGYETGNAGQIAYLLSRGHRKINFVPNPDADAANAQLEEIRQQLFNIGDKLREKRGQMAADTWNLLFIDEASDIAPKGKPGIPLITIVKRGRKRGVRAVIASQRPAEVHHTVLTQCKVHIVFNMGNYERGYFKRVNIPIEEFEDWIAREHHYVIVHNQDWSKFIPV